MTIFKPQQSYKRCIAETFKDFPSSSLPLVEKTLLAADPAERLTATAALRSEFSTTACDLSSLPKYPPSKEMDAKLWNRAASKGNFDVAKKSRPRVRAVPTPAANAKLRANLDGRLLISHAYGKSKSKKFPPPHQDGVLGVSIGFLASH